jgi:hypothetical protein
LKGSMMDFAPAGRVPRKEGARRTQPAHPRSRVPPRRQRLSFELPCEPHCTPERRAAAGGPTPAAGEPRTSSSSDAAEVRGPPHAVANARSSRIGRQSTPAEGLRENILARRDLTERRNPTFCAGQSVFERILQVMFPVAKKARERSTRRYVKLPCCHPSWHKSSCLKAYNVSTVSVTMRPIVDRFLSELETSSLRARTGTSFACDVTVSSR